MDILNRVVASVDFIEANLDRPITLADVSKAACFSPFHFHRIFHAFVGETVGDYIKRRRLTKAATELIETERTIIDIALDNFFDSQEAFTRSFERFFHLTPAKYRKRGIQTHYFDKQKVTAESLKHLLKGVTMQPKIVDLPEFKVIGVRKTVTLKTAGPEIAKQWKEFNPRVKDIPNKDGEHVAFGVCEYVDFSDFTEETPYSELVSVGVTSLDKVPEGMTGKVIPAAKYAVFTHKGKTSTLMQTYDYIYKTWLPNSNFDLLEHDDFEWYDYRFTGVNDPEAELDIYVPVVERK